MEKEICWTVCTAVFQIRYVFKDPSLDLTRL